MESNPESGQIEFVGSLYARLQALSDPRKLRGRRYSLALIQVLIILAKLCGENHILGISEWAKNRADLCVEMLHLKRKGRPHTVPTSSY